MIKIVSRDVNTTCLGTIREEIVRWASLVRVSLVGVVDKERLRPLPSVDLVESGTTGKPGPMLRFLAFLSYPPSIGPRLETSVVAMMHGARRERLFSRTEFPWLTLHLAEDCTAIKHTKMSAFTDIQEYRNQIAFIIRCNERFVREFENDVQFVLFSVTFARKRSS